MFLVIFKVNEVKATIELLKNCMVYDSIGQKDMFSNLLEISLSKTKDSDVKFNLKLYIEEFNKILIIFNIDIISIFIKETIFTSNVAYNNLQKNSLTGDSAYKQNEKKQIKSEMNNYDLTMLPPYNYLDLIKLFYIVGLQNQNIFRLQPFLYANLTNMLNNNLSSLQTYQQVMNSVNEENVKNLNFLQCFNQAINTNPFGYDDKVSNKAALTTNLPSENNSSKTEQLIVKDKEVESRMLKKKRKTSMTKNVKSNKSKNISKNNKKSLSSVSSFNEENSDEDFLMDSQKSTDSEKELDKYKPYYQTDHDTLLNDKKHRFMKEHFPSMYNFKNFYKFTFAKIKNDKLKSNYLDVSKYSLEVKTLVDEEDFKFRNIWSTKKINEESSNLILN